MPLNLKIVELDGKQFAETREGKPIYVADDGKEVDFDMPTAMSKIGQLNAENKSFRESREKLEEQLKGFDGITDPEAARKAMELVKNIDDKKLVEAGKVEEIKSAARKSAEESLEASKRAHSAELQIISTERDKYRGDLHKEKVTNAFANSKFIKDKVVAPVDLVQAMFGTRFVVQDDGKIIAKDRNGGTIHSMIPQQFGDPAEFDEALEIVINDYPSREAILRGSGQAGSGSRTSNGGADTSGKRSIRRSEFEKLDATGKQRIMHEKVMVID